MSQNPKKNGGKEKVAAIPSDLASDRLEIQSLPLAGFGSRWTILAICLFLALIVWIVFAQTSRFEFFNFDDGVYIYKDTVVARGLTLQGVSAAFSDRHSDNWVPLTTLSHMLDCQLFGLNAGVHHLVNVVFQTAATILLFLALRQMTGFLWRSVFVAAVFAIHPLRAESVAWVSERKDVLCGVFFALTLWAYGRYARGPRPVGWYLTTLFFFILGLLSKPTIVTLPLVMLLLDYWPLNRFREVGQAFRLPVEAASGRVSDCAQDGPETSRWQCWGNLILEKIPMLLLSFACCVPTILAERAGIKPLEYYPIHLRIENAIVSYIIQIKRLFYPVDLGVAYPYPTSIPWWEVVMAGILLVGICAIVWTQRRTRPWLLVGWFWYLGMITPNIGFIQVGDQAQADRHTYLPEIGLVLLFAWTAADLVAQASLLPRLRHRILAGLSAAIVASLVFYGHRQAGYWRNSETMWTHALDCNSNNFIAHNNLGDILIAKGQTDAAIAHYRASLALNPDAEVYDNLGNALIKQGKAAEAYSDFQMALQFQPNDPNAYSGLGSYYLQERQTGTAIQYFQKALQIQPEFPMAFYDLGNAYIQDRQMDQAVRYWQKAVELQPDLAMAHNNLGNVCMLEGHIADAIQHWKTALKSQPDLSSAQMNLAWVLATCPDSSLRDGSVALSLAQRANQLSGGQNPVVLRVLAAAYAEIGQFSDAIATAQKALELSSLQGNQRLAASLQSQVKCYQSNQPFRDLGLVPR